MLNKQPSICRRPEFKRFLSNAVSDHPDMLRESDEQVQIRKDFAEKAKECAPADAVSTLLASLFIIQRECDRLKLDVGPLPPTPVIFAYAQVIAAGPGTSSKSVEEKYASLWPSQLALYGFVEMSRILGLKVSERVAAKGWDPSVLLQWSRGPHVEVLADALTLVERLRRYGGIVGKEEALIEAIDRLVKSGEAASPPEVTEAATPEDLTSDSFLSPGQ